MENIIIHSNKDLEGKLWLPKNAEKGIVVVHSFRNTCEEPVCLEASENFAKKGYAVLTFDFLGHGKSKGELRDVSNKTTSENVSSAIQYLKGQGISKVGVYAISLGTSAAVLSEEQPDAQVFISPSPLFNPKGLLERYSEAINAQPKQIEERGYAIVPSGSGRGDFQMGEEWIIEMANETGQIQETYNRNNIPTLIIQGTLDEPERVEQAKRFIKKTGSEHLYISGGDHNLTNPKHRNFAISKAGEWFEKYL